MKREYYVQHYNDFGKLKTYDVLTNKRKAIATAKQLVEPEVFVSVFEIRRIPAETIKIYCWRD